MATVLAVGWLARLVVLIPKGNCFSKQRPQ